MRLSPNGRSFEGLERSHIYTLFGTIPTSDTKCTLGNLSSRLSRLIDNPDAIVQQVLSTLVRDLDMDPSQLATTQVALTMLAWAAGRPQVPQLLEFERGPGKVIRGEVNMELWRVFRDKLCGWDRHMLEKEGEESEFSHEKWLEKRDASGTAEFLERRGLTIPGRRAIIDEVRNRPTREYVGFVNDEERNRYTRTYLRRAR